MKKINISDVTLKKLGGMREVSLLFREKTAVATTADSLGADAIELAPIKNLREDTIIYKTISANVRKSVVAIPVGITEEDVKNAFECVRDAVSPRLQVEMPTSTVQMEYIYHLKADKMLDKISQITAAARKLCNDVEFIALDATRADEDFLINAAKTAVSAGAGIVTFCDDAGVSLPQEIASLTEKLASAVNVPVFVQVSDNISMAVASAISAIGAGASGLKCVMAGEGSLCMGKLSDALSARESALGIETSLKNIKIHTSIDDMLTKISHEKYKSAAGISDKRKIILDSNSTISDVAVAANVLGYDLSDEDNGIVYRELLRVCEKRDSVGAKELEALIASYAMQVPSTYHLDNYTVNCGNLTSSMAQVTLTCGDDNLCGVSTGDGPIDAAFRSIEQAVGYHYELDDFEIQAVTGGKEALGSAVVRLRNQGRLYSGNGISTDIVAASIRAYINALNKIVYEEK